MKGCMQKQQGAEAGQYTLHALIAQSGQKEKTGRVGMEKEA